LENEKRTLEVQVKNLKLTMDSQKEQMEELYKIIDQRKYERDSILKEVQ
jgi:hypothetical protein